MRLLDGQDKGLLKIIKDILVRGIVDFPNYTLSSKFIPISGEEYDLVFSADFKLPKNTELKESPIYQVFSFINEKYKTAFDTFELTNGHKFRNVEIILKLKLNDSNKDHFFSKPNSTDEMDYFTIDTFVNARQSLKIPEKALVNFYNLVSFRENKIQAGLFYSLLHNDNFLITTAFNLDFIKKNFYAGVSLFNQYATSDIKTISSQSIVLPNVLRDAKYHLKAEKQPYIIVTKILTPQ